MPLARIITKSADDSLELSMQLRSRGFRVETVAPDQVPSAPADLEVCLEECAPEEVLSKAALVKGSEDLWVFVAPGALDESSRPMRVIPLIPQVGEFRIPEHIAAAVAEIKPRVEVSVLEVRLPAVQPEDDPILSDLAAQRTSVADADLPAQSKNATPVVNENPVTAQPTQLKVGAMPAPAARSLARIKRAAVTKPVIPEIPLVPERVQPTLVLQLPVPAKPTIRGSRKSYKVAFQAGPKLWRTASVTFALVVLAGLLAMVVAVRPPIPASRKGSTSTDPAIFLPSTQASTADSSGHGAAPASPAPPTAMGRKAGASHREAQGQRTAVSRRRSPSDDGIIAKDTVVFYNRKPVTREAKLPAADVRRYSDAN